MLRLLSSPPQSRRRVTPFCGEDAAWSSDRSPDRPQDTRAAGPGILVHITPATRTSGEGGGFTGFRPPRRFKRGHNASAGQDASNTAATTKTHSVTTTPCHTAHHPHCGRFFLRYKPLQTLTLPPPPPL